MSDPHQFSIIDLFCGAGGLSLGFQSVGFNILCALDHGAAAVQTYRANLGDHVAAADLAGHVDLPYADVVIGGPPCQGFSSAGLRRAGDERNSLVAVFAQAVVRLRPRAFVFENVEGFLTAEHGERVLELLTPLIETGYRVHLRKINAANYGVPQHRKRVIAVGGLGWDPTFPAPTHSAYGAPGARLAAAHLTPTPTLLEAIGDLPAATSEPPGRPQGHFFRPLNAAELERASALTPGQTMRDLPAALQHNSYQRRANRRVRDGTPSARRGGAPSGIRRLLPDEPAKAITGGALSEFLHPFEQRGLTVRECARLQTFPDDFVFWGSRTQQAALIGNAVPPLLARVIAASLAEDLQKRAGVGEHDEVGTLLSFVPSLAEGYSPLLQEVTHRVETRFRGSPVMETLPLWD